ncbi:MAG: ABC transporter permease [Cytophagales bacterium]|nr:ABC transporter permease [Cytophagales bacterium]
MIRNHFTIAWRNLARHRGYSFINIAGLGAGMAVALLISLWVWDELSYNRYHQNHDRIAQVWHQSTYQGVVRRGGNSPYALAGELRTAYAADFEHVILSSKTQDHILSYGDRTFTRKGNFLSAGAPDMLTLRMLEGTRAGLRDPASILLSKSAAQALFGPDDPLGKIVKLDNTVNVKVTGVYEDLPYNTEFWEMDFIAPWALYEDLNGSVQRLRDQADWAEHSFQLLVQLAPGADLDAVSAKIKHLERKHLPETAVFNPEAFLHPMSRWHLHTGWDKTGQPEGRITYVWLFGIIGGFVLLLACINFMNLSTARSDKRAREVGIRKAIGSARSQLIGQFLGESVLMASLSFVLGLLLVQLALPFFNEVADKRITLPLASPAFWLVCLGFTLLTGLLAGSYPALYLSAFQPVKVLKGTFRVGRLASLPRKGLVVLQFTVSVTLIIGTMVVFRQIEHAKDRPIGYDRNGLIAVGMNTPELRGNYQALRAALLATGAVVDMATTSSPITMIDYHSGGFQWEGKDPAFKDNFGVVAVTHDFGRTVGWRFTAGRDFSRQFASDSSGMVLNAASLAYMGLKDPVGKTVKWNDKSYRVLGVVEDLVMESPFEPTKPVVFLLNYEWAGVINIKLNPALPARASLAKVQAVFRRLSPGSPFDYRFTDQQYAAKFAVEERIGTLATGFAALAVLISCLGLFGLASFLAERRTKEIGVRKVLGASVFQLWGLLSKEFAGLVVVAFLLAAPVAWYFLDGWLEGYTYRTAMPWSLFAASGAGALLITLLTVSYESIKAALTNPAKSLRSE